MTGRGPEEALTLAAAAPLLTLLLLQVPSAGNAPSPAEGEWVVPPAGHYQ